MNRFNILVLADFNEDSAETILEHVKSFEKYSKHRVFYYNPVLSPFPAWMKLERFNVIVIHYSIYLLSDCYLDVSWTIALQKTSAVKVQFIQDEYRQVNRFHFKMRQLGIDILYSCIPENEMEYVYPVSELPGILKINTLTGYVFGERQMPDFRRARQIDVGYRGRDVRLWWLGDLYYEKVLISEQFLRYAAGSNLVTDISSREADRIYGESWKGFLENCRCFLGTESGASIVDFTGEIEGRVRKYMKRNPGSSYREIHEKFLEEYEGNIRMNQISPRAFECICAGTCMILFEGNYSGILKPDCHYIPLKKDFSNFSEVLNKIGNFSLVTETARRAYRDIIETNRYSYGRFIESFDGLLEEKLPEIKSGRINRRNFRTPSVPFMRKASYSLRRVAKFLKSGLLGRKALRRHEFFEEHLKKLKEFFF